MVVVVVVKYRADLHSYILHCLCVLYFISYWCFLLFIKFMYVRLYVHVHVCTRRVSTLLSTVHMYQWWRKCDYVFVSFAGTAL